MELEDQRPQLEPKIGKKSYQIHRRASSKWVPPAPPISQRIVQPIQRRFDRNDSEYVFIFILFISQLREKSINNISQLRISQSIQLANLRG